MKISATQKCGLVCITICVIIFVAKEGICALSVSAGVSFSLVFDFGEGNNFKELDIYFFHKVHKVIVFCMHVFKN